LYSDRDAALEQAGTMAMKLGEAFCVVSGRKNGVLIYRIYPLEGFGLPSGGTLEEVVHPRVQRRDVEPPEKISTNGF